MIPVYIVMYVLTCIHVTMQSCTLCECYISKEPRLKSIWYTFHSNHEKYTKEIWPYVSWCWDIRKLSIIYFRLSSSCLWCLATTHGQSEHGHVHLYVRLYMCVSVGSMWSVKFGGILLFACWRGTIVALCDCFIINGRPSAWIYLVYTFHWHLHNLCGKYAEEIDHALAFWWWDIRKDTCQLYLNSTLLHELSSMMCKSQHKRFLMHGTYVVSRITWFWYPELFDISSLSMWSVTVDCCSTKVYYVDVLPPSHLRFEFYLVYFSLQLRKMQRRNQNAW